MCIVGSESVDFSLNHNLGIRHGILFSKKQYRTGRLYLHHFVLLFVLVREIYERFSCNRIVWPTVLVFFWMKKMQIGTKKSSKVLVSRAALSRRDCAGKDYRGTIVRFT